MTTKVQDLTIFQISHPDIVKRTSSSKLLRSAFMLLLGIGFFVTVFNLSDQSSTLSMALMVAGTAFILLGVFRLFWKSKEIFYMPTGSVIKENSFFFNLKDLPALSQLLEQKQFTNETEIYSEGSGNVRLDALFTQDHRFAALQLFQFVPYTYTPVTSVVYFTDDEAQAVSAFLQRSKPHA